MLQRDSCCGGMPGKGKPGNCLCNLSQSVVERRMYQHLLLSCSAWCDPLLRGKPTHTQHNLPSVRDLQAMIHDLPLKNADIPRLHNRIYPNGALTDGTYLRILQVNLTVVHTPVKLLACIYKVVEGLLVHFVT
jgi:hypothetical protein